MEATNPPAAREDNLENYNGLAAFPPSADSGTTQGQQAYGVAQQPSVPAPPSLSLVDGNRKYSLQVVQQPQRARMCGFGDKDRRPITPPPCIRLVVTDMRTGIELDLNDIDHSMYVLNVDLWNEQGDREVNLVRHSATSPSISATIPVSYAEQSLISYTSDPFISASNATYPYPPTGYGQPHGGGYTSYPPQQIITYGGQQSSGGYPPQHQPQPQYHNTGPQFGPLGSGFPPPQYQPDPNGAQQGYYSNQQPHYGSNGHRSSIIGNGPNEVVLSRNPISSTAPIGMFTRNLIGSLAASAFRLTDPGDRMGIWFVLQDLSVRTEGSFRLRLSFVNVGPPSTTPNGNPSNQNSILNTGRAPVLAACFTDVFTVHSAKKFPGVVESTPLSKCFATQGIKIPIRKDGSGNPGSGAAGGAARGTAAARKNCEDGDYDEED